MKRIISAIICCVLLTALLGGCDTTSNTTGGTSSGTDKTQAQYECGKKAYDELVKASDICEEMGDVIYNAWYFAIYEADDYGKSMILSEFCDVVGLTESEIKAGAAQVLPENLVSVVYVYLGEFDYAVNIVIAALEENGTVDKLDTALANAKAELKTMTQEYSDYSEYPTLKSLYSKTDSYATFLKSPTGSFQQLKTTIENYENDIRTCRSDLAFIFEE